MCMIPDHIVLSAVLLFHDFLNFRQSRILELCAELEIGMIKDAVVFTYEACKPCLIDFDRADL